MAKPNTIRPFILNLIIIIALSLVIIFAFFFSLKSITRHGESIKVPNLLGLNTNTAISKVKALGLEPVVLDSVFFDTLPRLSVVSQTPAGNAAVKRGRIVYLTVNRAVPLTVQMPNLVGYSLNSAALLLKSFGLRLGSHSYTANLVKDAVVKQLLGDSAIVAGTPIPMGTVINLVIGDGSGSQMMTVPDIIGMQLSEARDYISSMNCSIGAVTPDIDVVHSDSGYIYKQEPAKTIVNAEGQTGTVKMKIGGTIDVWVSSKPIAPAP
ncbi:MAG TPA: PASTA domain-containing protein [Arachidicoccus sp.]|nr:PASTA domain-containing protein [Arachidicoccus sp.]